MSRHVFYSFHYVPDSFRVSQVRNIGAIEANKAAMDNDWEKVTKAGDGAIQGWIDQQMKGRTCTVVLIGAETAGRKWINYEIVKSWKEEKGVLGIYINNLKDSDSKQSTKGRNPFDFIPFGDKKLSEIVKTYEAPYSDSKAVYAHIAANLDSWIEESIRIRARY